MCVGVYVSRRLCPVFIKRQNIRDAARLLAIGLKFAGLPAYQLIAKKQKIPKAANGLQNALAGLSLLMPG